MTGQMSWTWSTWRLTVVTVLAGGFWPTSVRVVRDSLGMSLSSRRKTDVNMFDGMGAGGGDESSEHTLGYGNSA